MIRNRGNSSTRPGSKWPSLTRAGAILAAVAVLSACTVPVQAQSRTATREATAGVGELSPATIRMLQHSLIQGGYAVDAADGVWGPKTAAAVREFQRVKGLDQTGRPDPATLEALGVPAEGRNQATRDSQSRRTDRAPEIRPRTPGDLDSATIRAVQQALEKRGFRVGPADGTWGPRTESAIGNFQRARGMNASGELDAHTLSGLGLLPAGTDRPAPRRAGEMLRPADLDPAAIRMIQQGLESKGFEVGSADGMWGDRTVQALREFQRSQGMEPSGEPDVYTLAALGLLPSGAAGRGRRP